MWYQAQIKYRTQDESGKRKTISETFLVDGVTFTDVEAHVHTITKDRLKDFRVKSIKEADFSFVYDTFVPGEFFLVKVKTDSGDGKASTAKHLVAAIDVVDAKVRAEKYMKGWLTSNTVVAITDTKILGVWHPISQQWQNDFRQRMADLESKGHKNGNPSQTVIDFEAKETVEVEVITDEARLLGNGQKWLNEAPPVLNDLLQLPEANQEPTEEDDYQPDQGTIDKYNAALDDLQMRLKFDDYEPVNLSRFAKQHGVTTTILRILVDLGAIEKAIKASNFEPSRFRKLPAFDNIRAIDILRYMRTSKAQPTETAEV